MSPHSRQRNPTQPAALLSMSDLATIAWQQRLGLLGLVLAAALVGGLGSLALPKKYEVHASFVGIAGSGSRAQAGVGSLGALAQLSGLAGLMGTGDAAGLNPYFFGDVAISDAILIPLTQTEFPDAKGETRRLQDHFRAGGRNAADSLLRAVTRLRRAITVDVNPKTGIVTLEITAPSAALAKGMGDRLVALLNSFVARDLQSRARNQRVFLESRLAEATKVAEGSQGRLQAFLESNRDFRNSPALLFRQDQLRRELEFDRDLQLSLARSLEEARLNELRDTPLISVIDAPVAPGRPTRPRPLLNALLLAAFSPLLWFAWTVFRTSPNRGEPVDA